MKALAILMVVIGIMAMFSLNTTVTRDEYRVEAVAFNYALFRNEVHRYVFSGHKASGTITAASLDLPTGWVMLRPWQARIDSGCLYVWGEASPEEIEAVRVLYWGSYAIGRASGGKLEPSYGGTTPVPSFVSEDNLVSVVSVE